MASVSALVLAVVALAASVSASSFSVRAAISTLSISARCSFAFTWPRLSFSTDCASSRMERLSSILCSSTRRSVPCRRSVSGPPGAGGPRPGSVSARRRASSCPRRARTNTSTTNRMTAAAFSELSMLAASTTPCSVKAQGRLRRPPQLALAITPCDFKSSTSASVSSKAHSRGKRPRSRWRLNA